MRDCLKDLNIVGATLAFREGELIRHCLDDLTDFCDSVVVVLDNQDKKTEKIVREYDVIVAESGFPTETGEKKGALKRRWKRNQGKIRQRVLEEVKKVHQKKNIDLLIWLDADECFTNYFPEKLQWFWEGDWEMLCIRPITVFDGLNILRGKTCVPNGRVFKYRPDISALGYHRALYNPFVAEKRARAYYITIHLAYLTQEHRDFRKDYVGHRRHEEPKSRLWILDRSAKELSPDDVQEIFKTMPHSCRVDEYLEKNYGKKVS